jgi:hypothetical protein
MVTRRVPEERGEEAAAFVHAGAEGIKEGPELVGAADAQADAIRSGADEDVPPDELVARDTDGVPVGRADLSADMERVRSIKTGSSRLRRPWRRS